MSRDSYSDKTLVEDSKKLRISFLKNNGYLNNNKFVSGSIQWSMNGKSTGSIGCSIDQDNEFVRLFYTHTNRYTHEETWLDYRIALTTTPCNYGGLRYWFECPSCDKRIAVLYLPYNDKRFACRACHNLTYQNQKEHIKSLEFLNYIKHSRKIIDLYELYNSTPKRKRRKIERKLLKLLNNRKWSSEDALQQQRDYYNKMLKPFNISV